MSGMHRVIRAQEKDLAEWMQLAVRVQDHFPGFEEESYRETVVRNMARGSALCVRLNGQMAGILLFSKKYGCLSCMAVAPEYRRMGIAGALIEEMLEEMDGDIWVDTFCAEDPKSVAPRALYKKYGFEEGERGEDFGYPVQRLWRKRGALKHE